jgi:hypothetical protein
LYFKLKNFIISQFGIRNIVLVIFCKNKNANELMKNAFFNVINHLLIVY